MEDLISQPSGVDTQGIIIPRGESCKEIHEGRCDSFDKSKNEMESGIRRKGLEQIGRAHRYDTPDKLQQIPHVVTNHQAVNSIIRKHLAGIHRDAIQVNDGPHGNPWELSCFECSIRFRDGKILEIYIILSDIIMSLQPSE